MLGMDAVLSRGGATCTPAAASAGTPAARESRRGTLLGHSGRAAGAAQRRVRWRGVGSVVVVLFGEVGRTSVRWEFGSMLVGRRGTVGEGRGEEPGGGKLVCRRLVVGGILCPRWCEEERRGWGRRSRGVGPCWLRGGGWVFGTGCSIVLVVRRDVLKTPRIGFRIGRRSGGARSTV